ncbi:hypothetical protein ABK040_004937 [Willaertia magna]
MTVIIDKHFPKDDDKHWNWLVKPQENILLDNQTILKVKTSVNSDFWRITHYGFIRDDGNFYYYSHPTLLINKHVKMQVKFKGIYKQLYDQAGLMIRTDEKNWLKTGIEFVENVKYASAVVTKDYSDWSTAPIKSVNDNNEKEEEWFTIRLELLKGDVTVEYSLDGVHFHLLRVTHLFDVEKNSETQLLQVGIYACSPQNNNGFEVEFKDLEIVVQ